MAQISADTAKRLYTLVLIGSFPRVAYGHMHVQQVNFFVQRQSSARPFTIHYHHHGPFSPQLADAMEQLLAMNYLSVAPLVTREGDERLKNQYSVGAEATYQLARELLGSIDPALVSTIDDVVGRLATRTEDDLLSMSHEELSAMGLQRGSVVMRETWERGLELPQLGTRAATGLDYALDPRCMRASRVLVAEA